MTRVLLDACVLVPATTRALLTGLADEGYFTPLWSPAIFAEWSHAAARQSDEIVAQTQIEQSLLDARFPQSSITTPDRPDLSLPDENDTHVLAAAIEGGTDELLTANIQDFPLRVLSAHGILRRHPDEWLLEAAHQHPALLREIALRTHAGLPNAGPLRKTFHKYGLNRFAKWLTSQH